MAFSLETNLNIYKTTKKQDFSNFSKIIYRNVLLTDTVKQALWIYVRYRLFTLRHHNFTPKRLNQMVDDMLSNVIGKTINEITPVDVVINENQIIFEIANSIYYKDTKHLYKSADMSEKIERRLENAPKPILNGKRMNNEELEDYFRGIMV